jgi:dihydrodipicolinate synthase/N-acetylneuraminate lyase
MKTTPVTLSDLTDVFAVPPLARQMGPMGGLALDENHCIVEHILSGGITRLLYGGNAFIYHIPLAEYEELVGWVASLDGDTWAIPSLGPSYGRAIDQARVLRRYPFPTAMLLPCSDPRDAAGLERGVRAIAEILGQPVILYLKEENSFGTNLTDGLDAVARLVADGVCVAIKYAIVRSNPAEDTYLEGLLARVDRRHVVSGIGERPAVIHMQRWRLPGFTTGSGCIAPRLSLQLFEACARGDFAVASTIRQLFLPLEDVRDADGPARVLHAAVEAAGIVRVGSIPPYVSDLTSEQFARLQPIAQALFADNARAAARSATVA